MPRPEPPIPGGPVNVASKISEDAGVAGRINIAADVVAQLPPLATAIDCPLAPMLHALRESKRAQAISWRIGQVALIGVVGTGRTVAQDWEKGDSARRREMLAEFEVRVVLHPTGHDPRVAFTGIDDTPEGFDLAG